MSVQGHYEVPADYGDRVRFTRSTLSAYWPMEAGEGTFVLCWLGVAETWTVILDDGTKVCLYPELGDAMELEAR